VTEENDSSSDEGGECRISVHRKVAADGVTTHRIVQAVETTLQDRPLAELSVALVDDPTIAHLHETYMNEAGPTDVITFDLRDDARGGAIEGEVVVSVDTARRQAGEFGRPLDEEVIRYVIHGVLHLLGMDDQTSAGAGAMRDQEDRILQELEALNRQAGSSEEDRSR